MTDTTPPTPSFGERIRRLFVTLAVAGVAAAAAAGGVYFQQSGVASELRTALDGSEAACTARVQEVAADRDAARQDTSRLLAFIDVVGARTELAQGNFGTARTRITAAVGHLRAGGHEPLAAQAEAIDIQVTEDLAATQEALLNVEKALSTAIDEME